MRMRSRFGLTSAIVAVIASLGACAAVGGIALARAGEPARTAAPSGKGTSLAAAAGAPSGIARGDRPAASVGATGSGRAPVRPERVLGSTEDRIASTGCAIDYGTNGECLPSTPPSRPLTTSERVVPRWTCAGVRALYPGGIALAAPPLDPLALDRDGSGVACDAGDGG